jgi:hypothetical protein
MRADQLRKFAEIEVFPDEPTAIQALQGDIHDPVPGSPARPPLPRFAAALRAADLGGVTLIRLDNTVLWDKRLLPVPMYYRLVSEYGRDRLVVNFAGVTSLGHPFHEDMFAILGQLGRVGGRLAVCGGGEMWLEMVRRYSCITVRIAPEGIGFGQ